MDSEALLQQQAHMTKALNPAAKVFVYRNVVKALPWFRSVREKLDDPAYAGWFLRFDPAKKSYKVPNCAPENASKCSPFYHDQEQTPEVPNASQPHPDGSCADGYCDCGGNPCGEYLFDHRNGSMLRDWIVEQHVNGPAGVGDPMIDGLFIDDYWCSDLICKAAPHTSGCPCRDPVQGPTEVDRNSQQDMGLSDDDIRDITVAWNTTMQAVQAGILAKGGYTWSLIKNQQNANASPTKLEKAECAYQLKEACSPASQWQQFPMLFGVTVANSTNLVQFEQDLAFFLLARGNYTWLGWGVWGMTWPFNAEPAHGTLPPLPHGVPRPAALDEDYGTPLGLCSEVTSGVFHRRWTQADVTLDCNTFTAKITRRD